MRIIDQSGRLFGRINVYDAAVALVVLAAVVAGVAFVDPFADGGEPATRYATVDLGEQPLSTAARISAGDDSLDGDAFTVTDTYVGPADGDRASVVVRARINGTLETRDERAEPVFELGDDPIRRGENVTVETREYEVRGQVLDLAPGNGTLATDWSPVLLETSVTPATAAALEPGDEYRLENRAVATVTDVATAPAGNRSNQTVHVGLSLRTVRHSGNTYFGDARLLVGRDVSFRTDRYALSGAVTRLGNDSLPGRPVTRTAAVRVANVAPDVADGLQAGMVERRDGAVVAEITGVRTEPASVVLTSDDGNIYERDHPRNRDVSLTVDLRVRRTETGLRFRARPLREGSDVVLDFRTVAVDGTVVDIEQ